MKNTEKKTSVLSRFIKWLSDSLNEAEKYNADSFWAVRMY